MDSASSRAASLRSALQRGIWLTIILTLLCAAAGGAFGWSRQRDARAESVILLNPLDGNPFSTSGRGDSLTNLETEAQLARGNTVAEQVQRRLGTSDGPEELLSGLGVTALVQPIAVGSAIVGRDMVWMLVFSAMLFPMMRKRSGVSRWDGGLLAVSYGVYLIIGVFGD